jgi:hypothetical protein
VRRCGSAGLPWSDIEENKDRRELDVAQLPPSLKKRCEDRW